jgi:membrane protease YdiL (CAAX protease family)
VIGGSQWHVWKTWLFVAATFCLAAIISPWLFNGCQALIEVTAGRPTNVLLDLIAGVSREADFGDFHRIALAISAILLFPFWAIGLSAGNAASEASGQRLLPFHRALRHLPLGAGFAFAQFVLVGLALVLVGSFSWRAATTPPLSSLAVPLVTAALWVVIQEMLFRGMMLGIFLRALRPSFAIAMMAALFALARFLLPLPEMTVADDESAGAGFELLAQSLRRGVDPAALIDRFLPLLTLGVVLGFARFRTTTLWLPIGLHGGWVLANTAFTHFAAPLHQPTFVVSILAGKSLFCGLIPCLAILLTGLLINCFIPPPNANHHSASP